MYCTLLIVASRKKERNPYHFSISARCTFFFFAMGQCLSIAFQVLEAAQEEQNKNNENQQQQQQQQQQNDSPSHPTPSSTGGGGGGGGKLSPIYPSLPSDAEEYRVRNVYDGDTLTLVDERRVRFLGVDTPELKEKQPFAEEAKAYTKNLCHQKNIWISFEPGKEREDHYGRLLCFVWTKTDSGNGYLCVNEGLVHQGWASAYIPNQQSKLHNWDKLVALQSDARSNNRGMWSTFQDDTVYKTRNGSAFHRKDCEHLSRSHNLTQLKKSEAMEQGLHACRSCLG